MLSKKLYIINFLCVYFHLLKESIEQVLILESKNKIFLKRYPYVQKKFVSSVTKMK